MSLPLGVCVPCSTASSRSHDSPAAAHVNATLVNILDEPLAPSELKEEPPSDNWDAFGAPAAPPQPQSHLPPVQDGVSWSAFEQPSGVAVSSAAYPAAHAAPAPAAPTNSNQAASWFAFDLDGQPGPQQQQHQQQQAVQPLQAQQQQQAPPQQVPQQQQQGQQQAGGTGRFAQAPPPAQPAKPPVAQELPLVSTLTQGVSCSAWVCSTSYAVCLQQPMWM